jgi:hypothetical protein
MLIDAFLPRYAFREHHSVTLPVAPDVAYRAVMEVRSEDIGLMDELFLLRRLPDKLRSRLTGQRDGGPLGPAIGEPPAGWPQPSLLSDAVRGGFVLLGEEPGHEVVLGLVGKLWAFFGSPSVPMAQPRDFLAFDEPGYARTAWNFAVEPLDCEASSLVSTETRVWVSDPSSRLRFGLYWLTIYPGSALIRRMMLRAVAERVQAPA